MKIRATAKSACGVVDLECGSPLPLCSKGLDLLGDSRKAVEGHRSPKVVVVELCGVVDLECGRLLQLCSKGLDLLGDSRKAVEGPHLCCQKAVLDICPNLVDGG